MIKLVAMDMDGTLLNSAKELPEENRRTIEEYAKKGVIFAFCTGRAMNEIELVWDKLPSVKYAITCNGALVHDISDRDCCKRIYGDMISMEEVRKIYEFADKLGFTMMFELQADGVVYAEKECVENPERYGVGYIRDFIQKTRVSVNNIREYLYKRTEDVVKLNIFFPDTETRHKALDCLKVLDYDLAYSEPTNIDINKKGSDKGRGLKMLMKHLNLAEEEVMAIGDNYNDLKLLQATPNSVVMKNAPKEIKRYAGYVTLSNDENGVAYAIRKFC